MARKRMKIYYILIVFLFSGCLFGEDIKLPAIIDDNMVLQQQFETPIWGWAKPGTKILIQPEWTKKKYKVKTNNEGRWIIEIKTPKAGGPYHIKINEITLKNVMIGEVWLCSGQSNMQWTLSNSKNAEYEIEHTKYPDIRLFYVARQFADNPKIDCYGKWSECNPKSAKTFSAVAYFFGRQLYNELNLPIGLIHSSWGGTPAEAWTRREVLKSDSDLQVYLERFQDKIENAKPGQLPRDKNSPSSLYNAMIAPLIPYGIKGAIWYQGEANRKEARLYEKVFPAMIKNWRDDWGQGQFPFYFVQIAPFDYETPIVGAALRDAQRKTMALPNTGMAVTLDIGNPDNIHPKNKQDVGKRLALWALAKDYGQENMVFSGPLYKSKEVENNKIRIHFDYVDGGLVKKGEKLNNFEIAGTNLDFHNAQAKIDGNSIVVFAEQVEKPAHVRYAFHNVVEPHLFNKAGLPASSFRTDDSPIITESVNITGKYDKNTKKFKVVMKGNNNKIFYTINGENPDKKSVQYKDTLEFDNTVHLKARLYKNGLPSVDIAECKLLYHKGLEKELTLQNKYHPDYSANGEFTLIDGLVGSDNFRDGRWQGFQYDNLIATIDLGHEKTVNKISTRFLQAWNSWIFFPKNVIYKISTDGKQFQKIGQVVNDIPTSHPGKLIKNFTSEFDNVETRYIRVEAQNISICPDWHPGKGGKAWLFSDEIIIE